MGKSNTTLLAWREPLYENLQSLVMSYFPFYFNLKGQMSLIGWAGPIKLDDYQKWDWRKSSKDIHDMSPAFYRMKNQKILSVSAIEKLPRANPLLIEACFLGADQEGLYKA